MPSSDLLKDQPLGVLNWTLQPFPRASLIPGHKRTFRQTTGGNPSAGHGARKGGCKSPRSRGLPSRPLKGRQAGPPKGPPKPYTQHAGTACSTRTRNRAHAGALNKPPICKHGQKVKPFSPSYQNVTHITQKTTPNRTKPPDREHSQWHTYTHIHTPHLTTPGSKRHGRAPPGGVWHACHERGMAGQVHPPEGGTNTCSNAFHFMYTYMQSISCIEQPGHGPRLSRRRVSRGRVVEG